MSRPPGRGGNGGAGKGPGGRRPRGSNAGPTRVKCGAIIYAPALLALSLLAGWAVTR